jgi:hypothetical protein
MAGIDPQKINGVEDVGITGRVLRVSRDGIDGAEALL